MAGIKQTYPLFEPTQKYPQVFCTPEDIAIAESVRKFVDKEVMPRRDDLEGGFHRDEERALGALHYLYRACGELGITKMSVPEALGGLAASASARMIVLDELSRGDIGLANMVAKMAWVSSIMMACRRDDLMKEFAPQIVSDPPYAACVAISEPSGGANIEDPAFNFRTLRTIAKPEGESYVINGHKIWPGPAGPAGRFKTKDLAGHMGYWTVATLDAEAGDQGVGIFWVPPDAPGLSFSKPIEKMGMSWTDENAEIWYDNVRIDKRYRIDTQPGQAAQVLKGYVIGYGRLSGGPCLTGLAEGALETALNWTADRYIGGVPVREHSAFAMAFGDLWRLIDISRQYYLSVTWQATSRNHGRPWSKEMMAKFSAARSFAADAAEKVTTTSMEFMGAYGYSFGNQVEKYARDYPIVKLWLGGAQRDRMEIAHGLYGTLGWPPLRNEK